MVEFRYLQLVASHVTDDRVTVGLAHWDGTRLRFALSTTGLRPYDAYGDIRKSLKGIRDRIKAVARSLPGDGSRSLFDQKIADLLPGHALAGDTLVWSDTRRGATRNPAGHFEELAGKLNLLTAPGDVGRLSASAIHSALEGLARDFAGYPELVRASVPIHDHYGYTSPVSWQNGTWNHAVPLNLDVANREELESRIRRILARVITGIPKTEVPVLVGALPKGRAPSVPNVEREAEYARDTIGSRAKLTYISGTRRDIDVSPVRDLIKADIARRVGDVHLTSSSA